MNNKQKQFTWQADEAKALKVTQEQTAIIKKAKQVADSFDYAANGQFGKTNIEELQAVVKMTEEIEKAKAAREKIKDSGGNVSEADAVIYEHAALVWQKLNQRINTAQAVMNVAKSACQKNDPYFVS